MGFMCAPSMFRIPEVPRLTPPAAIWAGTGRDRGYFAFHPYNSGWGSNIITDGSFCYSLKIGRDELLPKYLSINGYVYWQGNGYVYNTMTCGWIYLTESLFPGYEPIERTDYVDDRIVGYGDSFWAIESFPDANDGPVKLRGRGKNVGKEPLEMTAKWKRWTSNNRLGKYEPQDGASGDRYFGLPRFRGNGEYFVRSYEKENYNYTYGRIHCKDGKWLIGTEGDENGWWEGAEPDRDSPVTFTFCRNEDSEAEGSDVTVSLYDYVLGEERAQAFLGEVAIWR